jgi:Heparinase II/III-like protein
VWRSDRLFLAVRCGEIGVAGLGAHAHGDQLAIELVIDGINHVRDPGTYVYTPSPQQRNAYRSAHAHHVPHVKGREPVDLTLGLFDLRGSAPGECLYVGPRGFIGRHKGYGAWVVRMVALEGEHITLHDMAEGGLTLSSSDPAPLPFSQGYGRVLG